ncbi:MAG: hypothetical protein CK427_13905, partial [Leptospira sp.]
LVLISIHHLAPNLTTKFIPRTFCRLCINAFIVEIFYDLIFIPLSYFYEKILNEFKSNLRLTLILQANCPMFRLNIFQPRSLASSFIPYSNSAYIAGR